MKRSVVVAMLAGLMVMTGVSAASAGEITGNGKPLWTSSTVVPMETFPGSGVFEDVTVHTLHGRSECAFSGQEDLQFVDELGDPLSTVVKGEPAHAQSWGLIPKADRDFLATIGLHPSNTCNPNGEHVDE